MGTPGAGGAFHSCRRLRSRSVSRDAPGEGEAWGAAWIHRPAPTGQTCPSSSCSLCPHPHGLGTCGGAQPAGSALAYRLGFSSRARCANLGSGQPSGFQTVCLPWPFSLHQLLVLLQEPFEQCRAVIKLHSMSQMLDPSVQS